MLNYVNLNEDVRRFMLEEVDRDIAGGTLYISPRLSLAGQRDYPSLIREAVQFHDDGWLEDQLRQRGRINATERRRKPKGGYTMAAVPVTAPETLAEGEFNRFYARGLCRLAIRDTIAELVVYRAKQVAKPRSESVAPIRSSVSAAPLLHDLRTHPGIDTALRLPPGPNSGLSVRLRVQLPG